MLNDAVLGIDLPKLPPAVLHEALRAELARRRLIRQAHEESLVLRQGHPLYDLMHTPKRYKVYWGGRGGTKSWGFAEALVRMTNERPLRILCVREYQNSIADSVHQVLKATISRLGMDSRFDSNNTTIVNKHTHSSFIYKGLHGNDQEIKSTEGIDICWMEEGQDTSMESFETLDPTVRKDGSEIWISLNPKDKQDYIYQTFIAHKHPDAIVHNVNFDSNPYFPPVLEKIRQHYLRLIADADNDRERAQAQANYDYVWLGIPRELSDSVIFGGKYIVQEFPDDLYKKASRLFYGADFGFAVDPNTLLRSFIIDNTLYVEHEAYGVGVELEEMADFYDTVPDSRRWPIKCDNARPETISFLRGKGFNTQPAAKWHGSVEDGITHLRGFRKIIIHPRCKHTAEEARMYSYKVDRAGNILPVIVDAHNHCWDAIRYGLDGFIQRRSAAGIWAGLAA